MSQKLSLTKHNAFKITLIMLIAVIAYKDQPLQLSVNGKGDYIVLVPFVTICFHCFICLNRIKCSCDRNVLDRELQLLIKIQTIND